MEHQGVWILAEQTDGCVTPVSFELLSRGRPLADRRHTQLTAVVFGHQVHEDGLTELIERGADHVLAIEAPELQRFTVEPYAACLLRLIEQESPEILIAGATTTGRTLMPFVAIRANTGLTADCTILEIESDTGNLLQTRPAIGGNILATIKTPAHRPQMATVRPHSLHAPARTPGRQGRISRRQASSDALTSRVDFLSFTPNSASCDLQNADIVVAVGRGIKKAANIALVRELADALGAALGGSREVIDRGWLSYPQQIGLSGKTITPKLYIGIGVSGSIQHLAGMQTAETIVAINSDPDAQIFQVADIGIVADLFDVVPVLTAEIRALETQC